MSPGNFAQSFVATLPAGTEPVEVVVAPSAVVPEPDVTALALAAISALALRARG